MAQRRFWLGEERDGPPGMLLFESRFRILDELLDVHSIRAMLGRQGQDFFETAAGKIPTSIPFKSDSFDASGVAQRLLDIGLKGLRFFDQPEWSDNLPIASVPDGVIDMRVFDLSPALDAAAMRPAATQADDSPVLVPNIFSASTVTPAAADTDFPVIASFLNPQAGGSFFILHQNDGSLGGGGALLIDAEKREILGINMAERPDLTSGDDDQLILGGGMDGGSLGGAAAGHEQIVLIGGSDYAFSATDGDVGAGDILTVIASSLGDTDSVAFDGSAERDGSYGFIGGEGDDGFIGGDGDDRIQGLGGADRLEGGAGADIFHYGDASDSTGAAYDTLVGFDYGGDLLDLPNAVTGFDPAVGQGALSAASFDADLAAALGPARLGAGHAAWFTPDAGDLAGRTFLVVDANGQAGYQAGEDFVFEMSEPPPPDLSGTAFFV